MADYLLQLSYSAPAWAAMIKRPENRLEAVRKSVETLGGKINGFWLSFGDHDMVGILEMPDNVSAAAFAMAKRPEVLAITSRQPRCSVLMKA